MPPAKAPSRQERTSRRGIRLPPRRKLWNDSHHESDPPKSQPQPRQQHRQWKSANPPPTKVGDSTHQGEPMKPELLPCVIPFLKNLLKQLRAEHRREEQALTSAHVNHNDQEARRAAARLEEIGPQIEALEKLLEAE